MNTLVLLFFTIILLIISYKLKDLTEYIKENKIKISEIKLDSMGRNSYEFFFDILTIGFTLIFSVTSFIGLIKSVRANIPMDSSYLISAFGVFTIFILYKIIFIKKDLLTKNKIKKVII